MIEAALLTHLRGQPELTGYLAVYAGLPAIFSQEAPPDRDEPWAAAAPQYPRVVFAVDIQGDPERCLGGQLAVDLICHETGPFPEDLEPTLRELIHGWFFSAGSFTVAAQWRTSNFFTQPTEHMTGVTLAFDLLAFPLLTTCDPDVIERINRWTAELDGLLVINHDLLPASAWRPTQELSAIYWRLASEVPARWIPDTFQTIWRIANLRGHIFSPDNRSAAQLARCISTGLYRDKRLLKTGESPIMVNRSNAVDLSADPLRTGQLSVEATFGVIVHRQPEPDLRTIHTHAFTIEKEVKYGH